MLETLADHDDQLMEQLLDEIEPPRDEVFDDLAADLRAGAVTPGADRHGRKGQWRAAAAEGDPPRRARRRGDQGAARRQGRHRRRGAGHEDHPHRAWRQAVDLAHPVGHGRRRRRAVASSERPQRQGLGHLPHARQGPGEAASAKAGETVALGKLDDVKTGDTLTSAQGRHCSAGRADAARAGVRHRAAGPRSARTRSSCRRPCSAWSRRTLRSSLQHQQDSGETVLSGHGEMHLRVIIERLEGRNQIPIERHAPAVPYRETIRKAVTPARPPQEAVGRPRPVRRRRASTSSRCRAAPASSSPTPSPAAWCRRQYIPSVETGVRDFLKSGPLGFPVVDVAVNLVGRLLPFGRFLRHGLPDGGQDRHEGRHGGLLAGAARADHEGRDLHAVRRDGQGDRDRARSGAARSSASTRGRAGPAGTSSKRRCRSPRSAT